MKKILDSNHLIPSGAELRVLLNSEHISYGEVHVALKAKGIFPGNNDKSITVPLLTATLLTPSGFTALIDASVDRELKPKIKTSSVDLVVADSDWITPIKDLFETDFNPFEGIENIEVLESPGIIVREENKISIPLEILRRDISRDWTEREQRFGAEVTIEHKGGNLQLDIASTHSSKETELVNRRIIACISKFLKSAGITKNEKERRITFDSFSNVEQVRFFKRLTGGSGMHINKGNVNDMEINRDISGPPLPSDPQISWMNQTVKRLKIDGEKLNDIFLISDEKYYSYYYVQRMDITFDYAFAANSGSFKVGFFFSTTSRAETAKEDAELTFEILRVTHGNAVNADARKVINSKIISHVRGMIMDEFERIVAER